MLQNTFRALPIYHWYNIFIIYQTCSIVWLSVLSYYEHSYKLFAYLLLLSSILICIISHNKSQYSIIHINHTHVCSSDWASYIHVFAYLYSCICILFTDYWICISLTCQWLLNPLFNRIYTSIALLIDQSLSTQWNSWLDIPSNLLQISYFRLLIVYYYKFI